MQWTTENKIAAALALTIMAAITAYGLSADRTVECFVTASVEACE